jgi:hypothetical protein
MLKHLDAILVAAQLLVERRRKSAICIPTSPSEAANLPAQSRRQIHPDSEVESTGTEWYCLSLPIAVKMNNLYPSPLPDGQQPQILFRVEHSSNSSFRNHNVVSRDFGIPPTWKACDNHLSWNRNSNTPLVLGGFDLALGD